MLGATSVSATTITGLLARFNAFYRYSRAWEIVRSLLGVDVLTKRAPGCAMRAAARVRVRVMCMCACVCARTRT